MKLFDYKFIVLIALTLTVYFLYRELKSVKSRIDNLEKQETKKPKTIKNIPNQINEFQNEVNQIQNLEELNSFQEVNQIQNLEELNSFQEVPQILNNLNRQEIDINLGGQSITVKKDLSPIREMINNILPNESCSISEIEESEEAETTIDNELNEEDAVEIYSNDNINEINTSVESKKESSENKIELGDTKKLSEEELEKYEPNLLLKNNKLAELQDLAESLDIAIKIDGKKKTKLQLANEIYDTKSNSNHS